MQLEVQLMRREGLLTQYFPVKAIFIAHGKVKGPSTFGFSETAAKTLEVVSAQNTSSERRFTLDPVYKHAREGQAQHGSEN
jgi:hypothetical protein